MMELTVMYTVLHTYYSDDKTVYLGNSLSGFIIRKKWEVSLYEYDKEICMEDGKRDFSLHCYCRSLL